MFAALSVAMGSFVGCKDTSDDIYFDLDNKISALEQKLLSNDLNFEEALEVQRQNLQNQIDEMKSTLDGIKSCECDATLPSQISALRYALTTLQGQVGDLTTGLPEGTTIVENITNILNNYETLSGTVSSVQTAQQEMQSTVDGLQQKLDEIEQYDDTEVRSKLAELETAITTANATIGTVKDQAEAAQAAADAAAAAAERASQDAADAATKAADAATKAAEAYNEAVAAGTDAADAKTAAADAKTAAAAAKTIAEAAQTTANSAKSLAEANKKLAEQNKADIDTIKSNMVILGGDIANAATEAAKALALAQYDSIMIDKLTANNTAMKNSIDSLANVTDALGEKNQELANLVTKLDTKVDMFNTRIDSLAAVTSEIQNKVTELTDKLNDLIDNKIKEMEDNIDTNTKNIGQLRKDSEEADKKLQEQIDDLVKTVDDLKTQVETNTNNINKIFSELASIKDAIARQITGIEIQKVTNPWFGSFSTPFDISSNVLIAFYGNAANDIFFPSQTGYGPYAAVTGNTELTSADMSMLAECNPDLAIDESKPYIKAGRPLFNREDNTADGGEVYVTINPNKLDCSGVQMELVNTIHETTGYNLTPLAASGDVLDFGWTRAGGLYKTRAYVDAASLNNVDKVDIDMDAAKDAAKALKDIVKESLSNKAVSASKSDFLGLAKDMSSLVQSLRLNKAMFRTPWTDVNGEQNYTSSRADVAATAVKPLSFENFKDLNVTTLPGFGRANVLLDRVSNSLKNKVNLTFKKITGSSLISSIQAINIKDIEIADLTPEQLALFSVTIDTTFVISGLKYHLDLSETLNVPVKFTQDVSVPIKIDKEIAIDLSSVEVNTPTIVVTTDIKNQNGTTSLIVPVKDDHNNVIGNAEVGLDQIKVDANAQFDTGKITLDGEAVANFTYDENHDFTLSVDTTVSTTVNIEKWIYFGDYKLDANGKPVYVGEGEGDAKAFRILITRDLSDAATSLWGTAQDALSNVNTMLEQVRTTLDEVDKMLDGINKYNTSANNTIDNYTSKVKSYIQSLNDNLAKLINSANSRLQPLMLASDNSGIKTLSQTKNYPTKFQGSEITFTPTTWTMELVAPVCRKHVGVTNVFKGSASAQAGDADCKAALKAANTGGLNVNKRLDGQTHKVNMTGLKSGYIYEVAYSALDYNGKTVARKYYISVQ